MRPKGILASYDRSFPFLILILFCPDRHSFSSTVIHHLPLRRKSALSPQPGAIDVKDHRRWDQRYADEP